MKSWTDLTDQIKTAAHHKNVKETYCGQYYRIKFATHWGLAVSKHILGARRTLHPHGNRHCKRYYWPHFTDEGFSDMSTPKWNTANFSSKLVSVLMKVSAMLARWDHRWCFALVLVFQTLQYFVLHLFLEKMESFLELPFELSLP